MSIGAISSGMSAIGSMMQANGIQPPGGGAGGPQGMQQGGGPPPPPPDKSAMDERLEEATSGIMSQIDTDESGGISLEESGLEESQYNELDLDGDGSVTQAELKTTIKSEHQQMMSAMQQDGDFMDGLMSGGFSAQSAASAYQNVEGMIMQAFTNTQSTESAAA